MRLDWLGNYSQGLFQMILGTKLMKLGKAWLESQDLITSVKWMRRAGVVGIILAAFNIAAPVASLGGVSESGFGEAFITLPWLIFVFIVFIIILSLSVGILRQNKIAALGLLIMHSRMPESAETA